MIDLKNYGPYLQRTNTLVAYFNDVKAYDKRLSNYNERELFGQLDVIKKKEQSIIDEYISSEGIEPSQAKVSEILHEKYGISTNEKEKIINTIMCMNQRFIISIAKMLGNTDNILDLISEGNIGMKEAILRYDINNEAGAKFSTFAVDYIRRAITMYKVRDVNLVRKNNISKTYHIIPKARNMFIQEESRTPSADELKEFIKDRFGIDIKEITDMLDLKVNSIDEMTDASDEDSISNGAQTLYNKYSASDNFVEYQHSNEYNQAFIKKITTSLTERERKVLFMHYGIGYDREYEFGEIGEKLGYTGERVRQIYKDVKRKLNKKYRREYENDI